MKMFRLRTPNSVVCQEVNSWCFSVSTRSVTWKPDATIRCGDSLVMKGWRRVSIIQVISCSLSFLYCPPDSPGIDEPQGCTLQRRKAELLPLYCCVLSVAILPQLSSVHQQVTPPRGQQFPLAVAHWHVSGAGVSAGRVRKHLQGAMRCPNSAFPALAVSPFNLVLKYKVHALVLGMPFVHDILD